MKAADFGFQTRRAKKADLHSSICWSMILLFQSIKFVCEVRNTFELFSQVGERNKNLMKILKTENKSKDTNKKRNNSDIFLQPCQKKVCNDIR